MAYKYQDENAIDMNLFASILKDAVSKVKTEEDVDVLNQLKKVYKQNVPFTLRTYVAAYLAKQAVNAKGGYKGRRERRERDSRNFRDSHESREIKSNYSESTESANAIETERPVREPRPRVVIPEELAATVFVGIGRNRRVFPRDLVGILANVAQIERDRIGDIRVLANYSFIQLFKEDADKVIEILNGYDYRGRKLAVSYSRQKDLEDEDLESTSMNESEGTVTSKGSENSEI